MTAVSNEDNLRQELQRMTHTIERYGAQLDELDAALASIDEENKKDDDSRQVMEIEEALRNDPSQIAAEDALDNIVRLQNQLKIIRRRNELLARENTVQQKQLRDRQKRLYNTSVESDMIIDATGWHEDYVLNEEDQQSQKADVQRMLGMEDTIRRELKGARVIIKKKEQLILNLNSRINAQKERVLALDKLRNDMRVKQRECETLKLKLQRLRADDVKTDQELAKMEDSVCGASSLACMEQDRDFISNVVTEMKGACRRQDMVVKAQLSRQQQLQHRLDTVMKSLREMKLEKEFERNVAKSALVPSASREEPEDVSQILPEDECVPIDTYRLLYKNNEMMRTSVARKNMLVLEKESVIQAMGVKMASYVETYNKMAKEDDDMRMGKDAEKGTLIEDLEDQHQHYRHQIEELVRENYALKTRLNDGQLSRTPARSCEGTR